MEPLLIFAFVWGAMIAMSFWESYSEGRNAWDKEKLGWKIKINKFKLTGYHFWIFFVMFPLLLALPLVTGGWNIKIFGILVSAYFSGMVLQDFGWFVVNPVVKFKEFFTSFTDYYPWIKVGKKKIIPLGYVVGIGIAVASYFLFWS